MTILQTIIFSVIEAITEFLPVSSTAHLLLAEKILPIVDNSAFFATFNVVIQFAAIIAVAFLFIKPVFANIKIWWKLILAVLPTAVIGFVIKDWADKYLQDASLNTGYMLIGFGLLFSCLDWIWTKGKKTHNITDQELTESWVEEVKKTPWYKMVGIGLGQSLALVPGVSRSGASIYTARALGFSKVAATTLSFILGIAVITGASIVSLKDFTIFTDSCRPPKEGEIRIPEWSMNCNTITNAQTLLSAFLLTFIISFFLAKPLLKFLATKPFWYFGLWRIFVGILWLFLFWPR